VRLPLMKAPRPLVVFVVVYLYRVERNLLCLCGLHRLGKEPARRARESVRSRMKVKRDGVPNLVLALPKGLGLVVKML
jgi:hypothetical protein